MSLPKVKDFWRDNPLGKTKYGDSLSYSTAKGPVPPRRQSPSLSRFQTQMSQEEDDEMSHVFAQH